MSNPPEMVRLALVSVAELSGRILAGDSAAFEEFYRQYAPRVYGLVMVRVARKFRAAS